jgi:hypothetical protein
VSIAPYFFILASQKKTVLVVRNWKKNAKEIGTPFGNIVYHTKIHICTKYDTLS